MNVPFRLRLFVVGAAALTALAAVPGSASAAPAGGAQSPFAAQARQAGLTSAQAGQLQSRVDGYLARERGTQVAANEIRLAGRADLLLALPGRSIASRLGEGVVPNAAGGCPFQFFCAFNGPNFSGDVVIAFFCNRNAPVPFTGTNGSWSNNQTTGTVALFKNASGTVISRTAAAPSSRSSGVNWRPVFDIVPCQ